jgi:hypothetical protein
MKAFACSKKLTWALSFVVSLTTLATINPAPALAKTYTIVWTPNAEPDVKGYDLFLGEAVANNPRMVDPARPMTKIGTLQHDACNFATKQCRQAADIVIQGAEKKVVVAVAFDAKGNRSDYSPTAVLSDAAGNPTDQVAWFEDVTPPAPPQNLMTLLERIANAVEQIAAALSGSPHAAGTP